MSTHEKPQTGHIYNYEFFDPSFYDFASFPGPKAGEQFEDMTLLDTAGKPVPLSSLLDRPLVLETGSITCPMYARCVAPMTALVHEFPDVRFVTVYVREAHPGNRTGAHQNQTDKLALATRVDSLYDDRRLVLVDDLVGTFHNTYGSLPNMVYVINKDGRVVFRGNWNDPAHVRKVLLSLDEKKVWSRERFEAIKPPPRIALKALSEGGWLAVWDFAKGLPRLMWNHRKERNRKRRDRG